MKELKNTRVLFASFFLFEFIFRKVTKFYHDFILKHEKASSFTLTINEWIKT